jgi:hypothetical protein
MRHQLGEVEGHVFARVRLAEGLVVQVHQQRQVQLVVRPGAPSSSGVTAARTRWPL